MDNEFSYEIQAIPGTGGRFLVAVHHYRHLGPVSTAQEIEFDTLKDAVDWLSETLNA